MARSLRVDLILDTAGYTINLSKAIAATKSFAQKVGEASGTDGWKKASTALLAFGAGITLVARKAINMASEFEASMSEVRAAMSGSGLSGEELNKVMQKMTNLALEAGAKTKYSAKEAADGINELAKAGVSAADIAGGALYGALNLAASGNLGVADSAGLVATAMVQFNLKGAEASHVADLLAAGANKAMGDTGDLAMALKQGGLVAAQFGLSIEETSGTLAAFAAAGLLGSDAGTSFKTMLLKLGNPTEKARNTMRDLGISAYDAGGNFVGIINFAGQLQQRLQNLSPAARDAAMATIFGSDAIRAANVLYQNGSVGIQQWIKSVDQSGYASELAAMKQDNLKGDLEKLGGSFETLAIQAGSAATGPLRYVVEVLDALVSSIPPGFASTLLLIGGALGVIALVSGGMMKATTAVRGFITSLKAMSTAARTTTLAMGGIGLALTAATFLIGIFAKSHQEAEQRVDDLAQTLDQETAAITDNTRAQVANQLAGSEAANQARLLGISLMEVTDAALGDQAAIDKINKAISEYSGVASEGVDITGMTSQEIDALGTAIAPTAQSFDDLTGFIDDQSDALEEAQAKTREQIEATTGQTDAQQTAAAAIKATTEATEASTKAIKEETDAVSDSIDAKLKASGSIIALYDSYDDLTAAIKKNGKNIDITTEKGRANRTALDDMAKAHSAWLQAQIANGAAAEELTAETEQARQKFIDAAIAMGFDKDKAAEMADQYGLTTRTTTQLSGGMNALATQLGMTTTQVSSLTGSTGLSVDQMSTLADQLGDSQSLLLSYSLDITSLSKRLDDMAKQTGMSREQIDILARAMMGLPSNTVLNVTANTTGAQTAVDNFITRNDGRRVRIHVTGSTGGGMTVATGGLLPHFAPGGLIPNQQGIDTVPATISGRLPIRLDGGEFIVNRWATKKNLPLLQQLNSQTNWGRNAPGMANGGQVISAPTVAVPSAINLTAASVKAIANAVASIQMSVNVDGNRLGAVIAPKITQRQTLSVNLAERGLGYAR